MTLVELLAAVAVSGILLMAYGQIFLSGNASAAFITDMDELVDGVDDGLLGWPHLRGIVTQTRMGRNVVKVETNRLTVLVADTTLEYSLSGKDLIWKNLTTGAVMTLTKNVKGMSFKYYGNTGTIFEETADTALINAVLVDLEIEADNTPARTLKVVLPVHLRNKT